MTIEPALGFLPELVNTVVLLPLALIPSQSIDLTRTRLASVDLALDGITLDFGIDTFVGARIPGVVNDGGTDDQHHKNTHEHFHSQPNSLDNLHDDVLLPGMLKPTV